MTAKSIRHMRNTLVEREISERSISDLERRKSDFYSCSKMVELSELEPDRHEYWCNRFDAAQNELKAYQSSGNPESEEGMAIISAAKRIRNQMWHIQATKECTCADVIQTALDDDLDICTACEEHELFQDAELYF